MMRIREPIESGNIDNLEAFVTTVATRLAIDELRSARRRRVQYVGPWLPEPIVQTDLNPVELADSLSYALMVVLDALSPLERATFLLHDVFDFDYDELARMLDRTPVACRQLASRARRHVSDHQLAPSTDHATHVRPSRTISRRSERHRHERPRRAAHRRRRTRQRRRRQPQSRPETDRRHRPRGSLPAFRLPQDHRRPTSPDRDRQRRTRVRRRQAQTVCNSSVSSR